MGANTLQIRYDKIDGFIKIRNKIKYLILFNEWCDKICDRTKYLINEKSGIADNINHKFTIIRIDSYNSLPIEKIKIKISLKIKINLIQNIFK